jgi:hypothetical protein
VAVRSIASAAFSAPCYAHFEPAGHGYFARVTSCPGPLSAATRVSGESTRERTARCSTLGGVSRPSSWRGGVEAAGRCMKTPLEIDRPDFNKIAAFRDWICRVIEQVFFPERA